MPLRKMFLRITARNKSNLALRDYLKSVMLSRGVKARIYGFRCKSHRVIRIGVYVRLPQS